MIFLATTAIAGANLGAGFYLDPAFEPAERIGRAPLDAVPDGPAISAIGRLCEHLERPLST